MHILIGSVMIGVVVGSFLGLMIGNNASRPRWWKTCIAIILCMTVFAAISYAGMSSEKTSYNDGDCYNCGEKYEAITHKRGQTYYECPECRYGTWY